MGSDDYLKAQGAIDELIELKEKYKIENKLNECETRIHFIDRLLVDVLGWPNDLENIKRERAISVGEITHRYFDYSLNKDGSIIAVLEAKKEGVCFDLLDVDQRVFALDQLRTGDAKNRIFYAAVEQAINYGRSLTSTFSLVSNGHQIAAVFSVAKPGEPDQLGKVVVFHSLEDIRDNLQDFLKLFSYDVFSGFASPLSLLLSLEKEQYSKGYVLKSYLSLYPRQANNLGHPDFVEFQDQLKNECNYIISGIDKFSLNANKMAEFINECYVELSYKPSENNEYKIQKKTIISNIFGQLAKIPKLVGVATARGINPELLRNPSEPIIILGKVGVGKSIFIDRLIYKTNAFPAENFYIIKVDFLNLSPRMLDDIKIYVAESLIEGLTKQGYEPADKGNLSDIYAKDIGQWKKLFNDSEGCNEKIAEKLIDKMSNVVQFAQDIAKRIRKDVERRQIVIFLDNVDQLPKDIQRNIYFFARELMGSWEVKVSAIAMTPLAFYRTDFDRDRDPQSLGHGNVFTIHAASTIEILNKRISFIQKLISEDRLHEFAGGFSPSKDNKLRLEVLDSIISVLVLTNPIGKMIACIAGGNVRTAINMVCNFLKSPYSTIIQYLKHNDEYESVEIKYNNFLRTILKGEWADYDTNNLYIFNIFGVSQQCERECFLKLAILKLLSEVTEGDGYLDINTIIEKERQNGFTPVQILKNILLLEKHELIEPDDLNNHESEERLAKSYRLTSRGRFHLEVICKDASYLEEMVKVTPIFDSKYKPNADTFDPVISLDNADRFFNYLTSLFAKYSFSKNFFPSDFFDGMRLSLSEKRNDVERHRPKNP
ncbi:MAG: P-loop NTPase fold protein [Patescibacteria group bacterium]|jgi:DNA-binding PadR family transcriptional regulator